MFYFLLCYGVSVVHQLCRQGFRIMILFGKASWLDGWMDGFETVAASEKNSVLWKKLCEESRMSEFIVIEKQ